MFVYQIDIAWQVDYSAHQQLMAFDSLRSGWLSLKGSDRLIWVEVGELEERGADLGVVFKVGVGERDAQEALDIIQYFCFMLTL